NCMALDIIHNKLNSLKMLCPDLACDKSLQQLQSFLSGLAAEEKIELRDDDKNKGTDGKGSLKALSAALALSSILVSSTVPALPAAADISGLTPCKDSKQFAKREKQQLKKLESSLKLYAPDSAPALAIKATMEKTKRRFDNYGKQGLLCGSDGLPHLIVSGDQRHWGEFITPGILFLYIAGWIGWVGRSYLIAIRDEKKPTQKEIIIDVPLASRLVFRGFSWPVAAYLNMTGSNTTDDRLMKLLSKLGSVNKSSGMGINDKVNNVPTPIDVTTNVAYQPLGPSGLNYFTPLATFYGTASHLYHPSLWPKCTSGTLHDLAFGAWNMDTDASSHLNNSVTSLSKNFNTCMYPSISVGDGHSIPVTNTGNSILPTPLKSLHLNNVLITFHIFKNLIYVRQFVRDNNCIIEFDAFGFFVKDFMTRRVLLRCDSTGDLYLVMAPSLIPYVFLVSQHTWYQRLDIQDVKRCVILFPIILFRVIRRNLPCFVMLVSLANTVENY
nr:photosystem I reaction center subunit III, chloroplastic [Tanacetum cinerariifolium]